MKRKKKHNSSNNLRNDKKFKGFLNFSKSDSETICLGMFPTLVTLHKYKDHSVRLIRNVNRLEYRKNSGNHISSDIHELPEWASLMSFFKKSLIEHCTMVGYQIEDFQITQAWANKSESGQAHHLHYHVNSFLSGIFYVNAADGDTIFVRPQTPTSFHPQNTESNSSSNVVKLSPQAGYLAIFPSYITHGTVSNKKSKSRFSISFNSLPQGAFGSKIAKSFAHFG